MTKHLRKHLDHQPHVVPPHGLSSVAKQLHTEGLTPWAMAQRCQTTLPTILAALEEAGVDRTSTNSPTSISPWEEAVLLGTVMGDGHLKYKRYRDDDTGLGNVNLSFSHSKKQGPWLHWKVEQLRDIFLAEPSLQTIKESVCRGRTIAARKAFSAASRSLPFLNSYHSMFYVKRIKTITLSVLQKLEQHTLFPLILAVWFCDDGYTSSGNGKSLGFVLGEDYHGDAAYATAATWFAKHGFEGVLHKHLERETYRYFLMRKSAAIRFKALVAPYVHESMKYKLIMNAEPPSIEKMHRVAVEVLQACDSWDGTSARFSAILKASFSPSNTQRQLAEKFNVGMSSVSRWKYGFAWPEYSVQKQVIESIKEHALKTVGQ